MSTKIVDIWTMNIETIIHVKNDMILYKKIKFFTTIGQSD